MRDSAPTPGRLHRRQFQQVSLAAVGHALTRWAAPVSGGLGSLAGVCRRPAARAGQPAADEAPAAPAVVTSERNRPQAVWGVASGDVSSDSAILWSRTDRPAEMIVEYATTESMHDARRVRGPAALAASDFTVKLQLRGLPAGERIWYRVTFRDLADARYESEPVVGSFFTPPLERRNLRLAWSGDTAGQGWGIDVARGGMRSYATILEREPHVFLHSGDTIYADNPIPPQVALDDGTVWRNLVTPETSVVAQSLADYRGRFRYNLLDENVRRFNAHVAQIVQWDDHETTNNWYPGESLRRDARYRVHSASLLAAWARRAMFEYVPIRESLRAPQRIYRVQRLGPSLDLFVLDQRSYRGPNSPNRQSQRGPDTALLGDRQLAWLKRQLRRSRATWKIIAADMPIGLIVRDDVGFENVANGPGPPLGRELELADLLAFMQREQIRNVVWLTADVHYAAAHYYDPAVAQFGQFDPFWEFVAGPLHAGTFGPNELDDTFGPQVRFQSVEPGMKGNRPPSEGLQFFGTLDLEGASEVLTVGLYNVAGERLYQVELPPVRA